MRSEDPPSTVTKLIFSSRLFITVHNILNIPRPIQIHLLYILELHLSILHGWFLYKLEEQTIGITCLSVYPVIAFSFKQNHPCL